jgi:type I restriction enzyme S subunit
VENSSTRLARKEDIVVAGAGQGYTRGQPSFCLIDTYINQSVVALRANKESLVPLYLFYNLLSRYDELRLISDAHSSRGSLTTKLLADLNIKLPPLHEQEKTSKILSDLDFKIELNQEMNKTLEATLKAIFKHWFIDFEFPNEDGKPYKSSGGEIVYNDELQKESPKEWRVKRIGDVVTVKGGSTPSTTNSEYWDSGDINWCTPKDLSRLSSPILLDTERKITKKGAATISSGVLPPRTLLLSSRAPIGYLAISQVPVAVNQGFIAVVCDRVLSSYFMLLWLQHNMDKVERRAHGTTFQEINKASFREIEVLVPSEKVVRKFDDLAHPLFSRAVANEMTTSILSNLRDTLLPRLMSGKVRVPAEVR